MKEYNHLSRLVKKLKTRWERFNTGAIILDKHGNVLNYGFNSFVKTHPCMFLNPYNHNEKIFIHAECDAIYKCKYSNNPDTLIIARINKNNKVVMSKPCIGCYYEILRHNISKVYYTNNNGKLELLDLSISIDDYE
jgi:deoxycytidylate deaminase